MDDLLADFLTETNESITQLDVALVRLEQEPGDAETLSLIFRLVHTVKGTCGFLGLPRLEKVAHAAENVLGKLRDGLMTASPEIIGAVLSALDCIKDIVAGLSATGAEPAGDDTALIALLGAVAEGGAAPATVESAATAGTEHALPPRATAAPDATHPPAAPEPTAMPGRAAAGTPGPAAPTTTDTAMGGAQSQSIRVSVDVLEDLMTLVSELVLTRNQLLQLARAQENAAFAVPVQRLSQITSELQEGVMKTRMQPIGTAWNKLPRLVRDLGRELDKKIALVMRGAETELDRQVLELIKDPLTHMVRNSADHGLEAPSERRAAGKDETGTISLTAFHQGGHIIIEIADDGRGLPVDKIRAKILAKGLASEADLAGMSDEQVQRYIFHAGFSTAQQVTAVSGRGVGMDVVKTNIERIGGSIDLKSTPGRGTAFIIKIPLTLAIVSALIVEAGGERFAIPQISVVELVHVRVDAKAEASTGESVIERINDTPVLRLRERLLPLVGLADLLQLQPADAAAGGVDVVVTQVGGDMFGIIVDRVFDTEEIVVKPVAPILRHVSMFSGNTILGDGSVIMILDPNGIARATGIETGAEGTEAGRAGGPALRSDERTAMLLFRAGGSERMAVPLGLVARLEDVPRADIESSAGTPVIQYRGRLMPLIACGTVDESRPRQPVLVFADGERSMGLMVDEITDVVEDRLRIELATHRAGLLGSAVINGRTTDVIDTGYWLEQAWQDWFHAGPAQGTAQERRVLLVDDNDFFRQLLVPALSAAGYHVTAVASADAALALREQGVMFDVILSDIDMPGLDGFGFARAVRAGGAWARLPLIALSASAEPEDIARGREAGFTDHIAKSQRESLFASLAQEAAQQAALAA
jgi:two-component system chemotaxis sensor kinase CheA